MKAGAVKASALEKKGRDMRAFVYLSPTLHVDQKIAWAEKQLKELKARLKRLKKEREKIVAEHEGEIWS